MSTVHPRAAAPSARIRILGCEPPPPPRRRIPWKFVIACVVTATLGVALAVGVRHLLRPPEPAGVVTTPLGLRAGVNARAFPPTGALAGTLRASAPRPQMQSAARAERRLRAAMRRAREAAARQSAPVQVPPASPAWQGGAPGSNTVDQQAPQGAPAPTAPMAADAVTRPDLPPDPTDPNAQIDGP